MIQTMASFICAQSLKHLLYELKIMRNKIRIGIASFLIMALIAILTVLPASAYHSSIAWGSRWNQPSTDEMYNTCSFITGVFNAQSSTWAAQDAFATPQCTRAAVVYSTTSSIQGSSMYDYAINFHVGDFFPNQESYEGWVLVGWL
jgi:disulfide bond formation protein DsbB